MKNYSKKSFTILELVFVLSLISLIIVTITPKNNISKLQLATDKMVLYLNYIRYIAFIDNKYHIDDNQWEKKRWTLKFQKCTKEEDGLYFVVYSDMSGGTAHFKKSETMKDPLNMKYLYSGYDCIPSPNESKNILLTKEFGIKKVEISCNTTNTIGQISFGNDGRIYSSLGENIKQIDNQCIITFYDDTSGYAMIAIEPRTGFIHKL